MPATDKSSLKRIGYAVGLGLLFLTKAFSAPGAALSAGEPILLENTKGNFDFIRIDPARRRLLLAHTGNKSLDVFDLESRRLLKSVPTGAAQDSAVDSKNGRYYASVSAPPRMSIIDASTLEVTGEVTLPAAADLMTFNQANGRAYVCNDVAGELWVIDPETKKILNTITFQSKGMEDLVFDSQNKRQFQVVKEANTLAVIDPSSNKVLGSWTTAPATNPHGMALVPDEERRSRQPKSFSTVALPHVDTDSVLVAGGSGKLVLMNGYTGKVLASADISSRVDEMAYDPDLRTAYCGSSQNKISVVKVEADKLTALEDVSTPAGAKSIVVDLKTHTVWIAYSKGDQSFVQPFSPGK